MTTFTYEEEQEQLRLLRESVQLQREMNHALQYIARQLDPGTEMIMDTFGNVLYYLPHFHREIYVPLSKGVQHE